MRVSGVAQDIVVCLWSPNALNQRRLCFKWLALVRSATGAAIKVDYLSDRHCTQLVEFGNELAFGVFVLTRAFLTLEGSDPANEGHGCVESLDVKLVLERDGQAMQWAHKFLVL